MTISDFLVERLNPQAFDQPNFYFWVRTVFDAMELLGSETDPDLERMSRLLLDYYAGAGIDPENIDGINGIARNILRLGVDTSWRNTTPLGLKYRCLWNVASSRERNQADLYYWQYGIVSSFDDINLGLENDQVLITFIREKASKYGVDLYEMNEDK